MLGTNSGDPDVHREFIASKSADAEKVKEELATLHAEELEEKSKTVFSRDAGGNPVIWDYQIRGFLKEAMTALLQLEEKEVRIGKKKLSPYTCRGVVDSFIFVYPRMIKLSQGVGADCIRPLRAETMRGERVSLATSETVPAGTTFECEIKMLSPALEPWIMAALEYGADKGLGQWRNSGKGSFSFELLEPSSGGEVG